MRIFSWGYCEHQSGNEVVSEDVACLFLHKKTDIHRIRIRYKWAFLFYARVSSSEWELFGHIARSAFRRTPSGREMVA